MQGDPSHHHAPQLGRKASTSSLPALRRKISNGSQKAKKWIGDHLKPRNKGEDDTRKLRGTSREARPGAESPSSYASSGLPNDLFDDGRLPPGHHIPLSTLNDQMQRLNLKRPEHNPTCEWKSQDPLSLRGRFLSAESHIERPQTSTARERYTREVAALGSSTRTITNRSSSQPPPGISYRLRSDHQSTIDKVLPFPGPPPSIPLPPPPCQPALLRQGGNRGPISRRQRSPSSSFSSLELSTECIPVVHQSPPGSCSSRRASRRPLSDFPTEYIPLAQQARPGSSNPRRAPHRPHHQLPTEYVPLSHHSTSGSPTLHRISHVPELPTGYPQQKARRKRDSG